MRNIKWIICLVCIFIWSTPNSVRANCGTSCPDLWVGFSSEEELNQVKENQSFSEYELGKEATLYFILGSDSSISKKIRQRYLRQSVTLLKRLWKKNRKDDQNTLRLAYALLSMCDTDIPMEEIVGNVSQALGHFSVVVERNKVNMEARQGRLMIHINLPENMRPEEVLTQDAEVFLTGYDGLTEDQKQNGFIQMGLATAYLAQALVFYSHQQTDKARQVFQKINSSQIEGIQALYFDLAKKLS